ncbi:hypothetical protein CRG98_013997 [Punica granatum]|uniref:Uncharacterized protein n=1 Tax=Punica granatum TaxID=22663 RepID=A0A2I0KAP8_PUNGR|nr:hypothetical protein CRG98_013997 [Punica granatum]
MLEGGGLIILRLGTDSLVKANGMGIVCKAVKKTTEEGRIRGEARIKPHKIPNARAGAPFTSNYYSVLALEPLHLPTDTAKQRNVVRQPGHPLVLTRFWPGSPAPVFGEECIDQPRIPPVPPLSLQNCDPSLGLFVTNSSVHPNFLYSFANHSNKDIFSRTSSSAEVAGSRNLFRSSSCSLFRSSHTLVAQSGPPQELRAYRALQKRISEVMAPSTDCRFTGLLKFEAVPYSSPSIFVTRDIWSRGGRMSEIMLVPFPRAASGASISFLVFHT